MSSGPWYDGTPRYTGRRRVTEPPPRDEVRHQDEIAADRPDAETIFSDLAHVANKAKVLAERIEEVARPWIDVPESDRVIRAAVRRKDQSVQDGSRITFDLFKDAILHFERRREAVKAEDFHDLTGNAVADHDRIRGHFEKSSNPDMNAEELALYASELTVIWVLHQMMGPWRAADQSQVVSGKSPPSTEVPGLISQTVIGLAMQLLIYGIEERALRSLLQQTGSYTSNDVDTIIQRAKSQAPSRMQELAARKFGEGDYEQILRYSLDHIGRSTDPGYEMWLGYYETRRIRHEAMMAWRAAPQYSAKHAIDINFGSSDLSSNSPVDAAILGSIIPANTTYLCALRDHHSRLDSALDTIAQVLSSRLGQDALCCIGLFLERMDTKWLQRTHQLLHILMMSQRPILQVDAGLLASNLMTMLVDRIQQELIHLVDQISHKIASPVLDRIEVIPDDDWNRLFACPLIRNLVDCILLAVDNLINVTLEILPQLTIRWDAQFGASMQDRWMVINTRRKIQVLLATLDQVTAALESGLLCAEDSGTYTEESIRRLAGGIPEMPHIELAPEEISRYFRDTGPVVVTRSMPGAVRDSVPPAGDPVIRTGIKGENDEPMTPRRCREVFEEILRSMEE